MLGCLCLLVTLASILPVPQHKGETATGAHHGNQSGRGEAL